MDAARWDDRDQIIGCGKTIDHTKDPCWTGRHEQPNGQQEHPAIP